MCHSSLHHYDLRANVRNWFYTYFLAVVIHYIAFALPDQIDFIYLSGVSLGGLIMWALEMAREWIKTWARESQE